MDSKNRVGSLDLLKGIACIGVVFIHYTFPGMVGQGMHKLAEFAVPIFIMISGFFAYGCDVSVIKKRLLHLIKLFAVAIVLFFLLALFSQMKNHNLGDWLKSTFSIKNMIYAVVFCTISFADPLWYFVAMIETYLFWIVVLKHGSVKQIERFNYLFFVFGIVLTTIVETCDLEWSYKVNFLGRALPWFVLGHKMQGTYRNKCSECGNWTIGLFTLISAIVSIVPVFITVPINFSYIGIVCYSIGLFMLALKNSLASEHCCLVYIGRELSPYIYIFHVLIATVLYTLIDSFTVVNMESLLFLWIWPLIVLLVSILFSALLKWIGTKHRH